MSARKLTIREMKTLDLMIAASLAEKLSEHATAGWDMVNKLRDEVAGLNDDVHLFADLLRDVNKLHEDAKARADAAEARVAEIEALLDAKSKVVPFRRGSGII